jgi:hypothetical protein
MWNPVLDDSSKKYYFWNTTTQETSWEPPSALNISHMSLTDPFFTSKEYADWYAKYGQGNQTDIYFTDKHSIGSVGADGSVAGAFNAKTGTFMNISRDDRGYVNDPKSLGVARAERHMNQFFDYAGYQEQRGSEAQSTKKHKVTAKDIKRFKAKKEERKRRKLLREYRDDIDMGDNDPGSFGKNVKK